MNILILTASATAAQWTLGSGNLYNDLLIIALVIVMISLLLSAVVVQKALKVIINLTMPELAKEEKEKKKKKKKITWNGFWNWFLELRPIEEEKDVEIDHEYDGIKELNNPIPVWFNALFYSTVVFGVVYLLVYHVFGWGLNQDQEYEREMAMAEKAKQEYLSQAANLFDESTITIDETGTLAAAGKSIFVANCVVCHGALGEGGIGPNLVDDYWIHGGEIGDVFRVVKYGVPDKGMVPWEQTLTPGQIAEVSNYIVSLRGTTPPNAKEPQGEKVVYQDGAGADSEETLPEGGNEEAANESENDAN